MSIAAPHFLLYTEAGQRADCDDCAAGHWRFALCLPQGQKTLEAADLEDATAGDDRLELLAIVRGLEALEQPSRVTLMTSSRNVRRGLDWGLAQWRASGWRCERYGRLTPVKNRDLWQRLDRLLEIHRVEFRPAPLTKADDFAPPPAAVPQNPKPRRTRNGKVVRLDAAHAAAKSQITRTKSQTNSKFKGSNDRSASHLAHWNFLPSNLFDAWCLVIGALKLCRRPVRRAGSAARRLRKVSH